MSSNVWRLVRLGVLVFVAGSAAGYLVSALRPVENPRVASGSGASRHGGDARH